MKKPVCYILVGVPASGKSTWIKDQNFDQNTVIASTDNYIDWVAECQGKTYNEVFKDNMTTAVEEMANTVVSAVNQKKDIVWDQTSTSVEARAKKFRMLPKEYTKIAVVFETPSKEEHARRLASRPGKNIPTHVIASMQANFVMPSESEGFDKIIVIN